MTGMPLFCVPWSEYEDGDHLLSPITGLGALPDDLFKKWKSSSLYYTPEGELYNIRPLLFLPSLFKYIRQSNVKKKKCQV